MKVTLPDMQAVQRLELQPLNKFLAGPYALPASFDHLQERLNRNVGKFQANYLAVVSVGLLLYSYIFPSLFLALAVGGACAYAGTLVEQAGSPLARPLQLNDHTLSAREKRQALAGIAVVVLLLSGALGLLLWGTLAPSVACLAHAGLKQTSLASRAVHAADQRIDAASAKAEAKIDQVRKRVTGLFK